MKDQTQLDLGLLFAELKGLKRALGLIDEEPDPAVRAFKHEMQLQRIKRTEEKIDEIMRRA